MSGVDAFLGSWREEEKEGYDEMAKELGLPDQTREFFRNARTEIEYKKNGDVWTIVVGMAGAPQNRTFTFKLGEQYESASLDGSPLNSVMKADGDKFVENHVHTNMNGMEMNIIRHIEDGKMIVTTKVGTLEMKSKYKKLS